MPNRVIRDWTDSEKITQLNPYAERFFTRLIMKVDDYGRFHANPKLLKPNLFPFLLDEVTEADIETWLSACVQAGIVIVYIVSGKPYLQIQNFKQVLRQKRLKYPAPPPGFGTDEQLHNTQHASAYLKGNEFEFEPETEFEIEPETEPEPEPETEVDTQTQTNKPNEEREKDSKNAPAATLSLDERINILAAKARLFKQMLRPYVGNYPAAMLQGFFQYWTEADPTYTHLRFEMQKTWELQKRLTSWAAKENTFTKNTDHAQNNNLRKGQPDISNIRAAARKILANHAAGKNNG